MLRLPDHWVWDSWYAEDDQGRHHVFFLRASRALLDPERRHRRASIGHAASRDLRSWRLAADALVAADAPAWDDLATWTGSVVRGPDRRWYLFYTGVSRADGGRVQRIGLATSADLFTWHRFGARPLVEADPTWYERLERRSSSRREIRRPGAPDRGRAPRTGGSPLVVGDRGPQKHGREMGCMGGEDPSHYSTGARDPASWPEEAWRDPWVLPDGDGGWHMLITARANHGPAGGRGVIGHAFSTDLLRWEVRPPLTRPAGFGHLEVPQAAVVDGQPLLLFCTNAVDRPGPDERIWAVPGPSLAGPWDMALARPVACRHLYAPRLVRDAAGAWQLIGFVEDLALSDPVAVRYTPDGGLRAVSPSA